MENKKTVSKDLSNKTVESRLEIGFEDFRKIWSHANATYTSEGNLEILGHPVMQTWEENYMDHLADVVTRRKGRILEVGYGLGISASKIQLKGIDSHLIIEANSDVFKKAIDFSDNSSVNTTLFYGMWQDCVMNLRDESFDGILFDTYPLSEDEIHGNHFPFFREAYRLLKKGGVFTYYSDEPYKLNNHHIEALVGSGFNDISYEICEVQPPENCSYWKHDSIVAPIVIK